MPSYIPYLPLYLASAAGKKAIAFMALDNDVPTNSMTALQGTTHLLA